MKLPNLLIRLVPNATCIRCGQHGYVAEKAEMCLGCMNIATLIYAKRKKAEVKP